MAITDDPFALAGLAIMGGQDMGQAIMQAAQVSQQAQFRKQQQAIAEQEIAIRLAEHKRKQEAAERQAQAMDSFMSLLNPQPQQSGDVPPSDPMALGSLATPAQQVDPIAMGILGTMAGLPGAMQGAQMYQQQQFRKEDQAREIEKEKRQEVAKDKAAMRDVYKTSDIESLKKAREDINQASIWESTLGDFGRAIDDVSDWQVGPVAEKFGNWSEETQALESVSNQISLMARGLLDMPASGFSDADRDFLQKIAGGTAVDKPVLLKNKARLERLVTKAKENAIDFENYISEHGSSKGHKPSVSAESENKDSDPLGIRY